MRVIGHPPVTASPLDERRGADEEEPSQALRYADELRGEVPTRSFFDLPTGEAYFSVRRREATRKTTKPIAKGRAVTE